MWIEYRARDCAAADGGYRDIGRNQSHALHAALRPAADSVQQPVPSLARRHPQSQMQVRSIQVPAQRRARLRSASSAPRARSRALVLHLTLPARAQHKTGLQPPISMSGLPKFAPRAANLDQNMTPPKANSSVVQKAPTG